MTEATKEDPRQCWATPPEFWNWVNREFGPFDLDVCASAENKKCECYITRAEDGLRSPWAVSSKAVTKCWCNPGFANVAPWLAKAYYEAHFRRAHTFVLTHAAHSTDWFRDHIDVAHRVYAIRPRINFVIPNGVKKASSNPRESLLWEFKPDASPTDMIHVLGFWKGAK